MADWCVCENCTKPAPEPRTIKRGGAIGFRDMSVKFYDGDQFVAISDKSGGKATFHITDFLNLMDQAVWYFDQFASREGK